MPRTPTGVGGRATSQPQPTQPTQARTRSSQGAGCLPTREELVKLNQEASTSAAQAREYLEKQGYTPPDEQGGKASLSYTLLLLAHCALPSILPKAIRAVAAVLEHEEANHTADTIVAAVMRKLDPALNLMTTQPT